MLPGEIGRHQCVITTDPNLVHYAIHPGIKACLHLNGKEVYDRNSAKVTCKDCLKLLKRKEFDHEAAAARVAAWQKTQSETTPVMYGKEPSNDQRD